MASSRVVVDLHLGQAVLGHLLGQVLEQLLLRHEVALLWGKEKESSQSPVVGSNPARKLLRKLARLGFGFGFIYLSASDLKKSKDEKLYLFGGLKFV